MDIGGNFLFRLRGSDLSDLLRTVSKKFYPNISALFLKFKGKSLFFSNLEGGHSEDKRRLVVGEFARNPFTRSTRFGSFFANLGQWILSDLRHLRVC